MLYVAILPATAIQRRIAHRYRRNDAAGNGWRNHCTLRQCYKRWLRMTRQATLIFSDNAQCLSAKRQ